MEHKLAALMMADVVGYSRLVGLDEAGTLTALKTHHDEILAPSIAEQQGRIVKLMGDGVLAEFSSAVDAMAAAVKFQEAMAARNATSTTRIDYRVGVHLGDVVIEGDDIFGVAVSIAARLETEAAPGGICLSDHVRAQIEGRLDLGFTGGDVASLKNIEQSIRVWHWTPNLRTQSAPAQEHGRHRPTIAVLPFENISGDQEQEYFADGLTEDLITALTHWRSFPVIARYSSFAYKGKPTSVVAAAQELGATYIVEGSVRKAGQRARITAQLVDGRTGHHVWAKRYDRQLEDVFEVQDDLVLRVAAVIAPEVNRAELSRTTLSRTTKMDAWDHFLRGEAALATQTSESLAEAREHFLQAIELDPQYSDAFVGVATTYSNLIRMGAAGVTAP